jgi:hypothetical protein
VGLVGVAFFLGGISNLPDDLDAARAAGSPTKLTITFRVVAAIFGIGFAALAGAELVTRFRKRREHMEGRHESWRLAFAPRLRGRPLPREHHRDDRLEGTRRPNEESPLSPKRSAW